MTIETANRLVEYRKKHGFSQEDVAERIGVSRQAVSKWERAEASPDTDNLIALAALYQASLDELVLGRIPAESDPESGRITVTKGKKTVVIEPGADGHIFGDGMHIHVDEDCWGDEDDGEAEDRSVAHRFFRKFPFPVLTVIAYLFFGFWGVCGGWGYGWLIFLSVPVYYTLVEALFTRRPSRFAYPVLLTWGYLWAGFEWRLWHPLWILFITIPIYYYLVGFMEKKPE